MHDSDIAVIFDLDSTLTDSSHRHHLIDKENAENTDWVAYSMACEFDTPQDGVVALAQILHPMFYLAIVTGRSAQARELTEKWLDNHNVPYDELVMREVGDFTSNSAFKEHHARLIRSKRTVVLAIDDWPATREAYASLYIPTLIVNPCYAERKDNDPILR